MAKKMRPRVSFEVYKAKDGWRWRARARNSKIVADGSEAYSSRRNCRRALYSFIESAYGLLRGLIGIRVRFLNTGKGSCEYLVGVVEGKISIREETT